MGGGAHHAIRVAVQRRGAGVDQRRRNQGLVALHVDGDVVVAQLQQRAGLGEAIAAGRVIAAGEQRADAMRLARGDDVDVVCSHHHAARSRLRSGSDLVASKT